MKHLFALLLLPLTLAACDPGQIETACAQATSLEGKAEAALVAYKVQYPDDPLDPALLKAWESAKVTKSTICSPAVQAAVASIDA